MSTKGERIWNDVNAGNIESLSQNLVDATPADLRFEKMVQLWNNFDLVPLAVAAWKGHAEIAKMLIAKGADVNHQDSMYKKTILMWAAEQGHTATVQVLLEAKADLNRKCIHGTTPLLLACWSGYTSVVQQLLDAGADINIQTNLGETVLMTAAMQRRPEVVKVLLQAKAAINMQDKNGWTALMHAANIGEAAIVDSLLQAGADCSLQSTTNQTAADLAKTEDIRTSIVAHAATVVSFTPHPVSPEATPPQAVKCDPSSSGNLRGCNTPAAQNTVADPALHPLNARAAEAFLTPHGLTMFVLGAVVMYLVLTFWKRREHASARRSR